MGLQKRNNDIFDDVGRTEGLVIWSIEDSKTVKRLLDEVYGQFYDSECYLILKTYGIPAYSWDIHFWLGSNSSTDLQTVAAYRATELDKHLNLKAKQFREVQNHESPAFLALFKDKIRYLAGEKHSIIRASSKHFKKRLYLVKGKRNCRVLEVPFVVKSLKDQSSFLNKIFYKKVHVVAINFCFGSKFEFVNPEEINEKQNCMKNLNEFVY